ncbi:hypothetical protein CYY_010278 [Polysphondylium violaceum]|uniref:FNIP repeat-containing protein n=1 Tax=Polysphondylium violaceum TaxID=133409 RepID=A0A8J4PJD5_9MYCE|nr:hypothetical protein CYY_010278 [Polysphondylium violaceum]
MEDIPDSASIMNQSTRSKRSFSTTSTNSPLKKGKTFSGCYGVTVEEISSFYLIWRNQYIRRLIRNIVCQDVLIRVNNEYLCDNQQYLSLFSNIDKVNHNIRISFLGKARDYLDINNSNRDLINDAELSIQSSFNFNEIHNGVHTLVLKLTNLKAAVMGQLPDSITKLRIFAVNPPIVQHLISNLPCKLQELDLMFNSIESRCVLPQSLTDLDYTGSYDSMKKLVVPPNKVYKNCGIVLDSNESFQCLLENKFISVINIGPGAIPMLKSHPLPSHVSYVYLNHGHEPDLLLPHTVENLFIYEYGTPFSHISHLKDLEIDNEYPIKLEKGVLPRSLETLSLYYNQPLEPDVFPNQLKTLYLHEFNQPLCVNVLPSSLTDLYLSDFYQPLNTFVLPQKLKRLNLHGIKQLTPDSLPVSLTDITLFKFKASFDQCQPLDNLKKLQIGSLFPSVGRLLTNVKKLDLFISNTTINDPSGTCLANTSIENLHLSVNLKSTLYPNSFPPTIKYLSLANVVIESDNVIPSSCRYLKSKFNHIDTKYVPKSVRYIKSIQENK